MPFKTKKRKLAASSRRFAFDLGQVKLVTNQSEGSNLKKAEAGGLKLPRTTSQSIGDLPKIERDFLKIAILSIIIVAAQIVLRLTLK